ncbi:hypothetical protein FMUBM48_36030 [Nocardia cyriacigeorgica]|nr:hypothetical protein FMUBM48_36030 [Nocardia cyriacigeorgica]
MPAVALSLPLDAYTCHYGPVQHARPGVAPHPITCPAVREPARRTDAEAARNFHSERRMRDTHVICGATRRNFPESSWSGGYGFASDASGAVATGPLIRSVYENALLAGCFVDSNRCSGGRASRVGHCLRRPLRHRRIMR